MDQFPLMEAEDVARVRASEREREEAFALVERAFEEYFVQMHNQALFEKDRRSFEATCRRCSALLTETATRLTDAGHESIAHKIRDVLTSQTLRRGCIVDVHTLRMRRWKELKETGDSDVSKEDIEAAEDTYHESVQKARRTVEQLVAV